MITYEKTEDSNIVKEVRAIEREISISTLEKRIEILTSDLEMQPNSLEYPKDASDQMKEAVDLWNLEHDSVFEQAGRRAELASKKELLAKCKLAK